MSNIVESQENQPINPNFTLSRRNLSLFLPVIGAALLSACTGGQPTLDKKQSAPTTISTPKAERTTGPTFVDPFLQQIGGDLERWEITTLDKSLKMTDLFSDVKLVTDILTGKIDPRVYLSHLRLPITLGQTNRETIASLQIAELENPQDTRKIEISNQEQALRFPWIREVVTRVQLSDDLKATTTARLPFIVKELIHIKELSEYYKFYLTSNKEAISTFVNPSQIPTPEDQILYSRGTRIESVELNSMGYSPLLNFLDAGTGIKVFSPLYATWQLNEQRNGRTIPNTDWSRIGNRYVNFLNEKKLLAEQDGIITWVIGKTPKIDSFEFVQLVDDYLKRFYQRALLN